MNGLFLCAMTMPDQNHTQPVDQAIKNRRTTKVFAEENNTEAFSESTLRELFEVASWAPFHRKADSTHLQRELNSPVPWRFYTLLKPECIAARQFLLDRDDTGKLPQMLAVATAMVNVTWLPNPTNHSEKSNSLFDGNVANMEHIAAASSAIQNLLIAATAREIPTYWSSGGAFRKPELFAWLGMPIEEVLLGSIFFFPKQLEDFNHVPGKLRQERGDLDSWCKFVKP